MLFFPPVLVHFDPALPIQLAAEASEHDGNECPIAFALWTLSTSEKNHTQLEKEALAFVFEGQRFHRYLYGRRRFTLVIDHKPSLAILGPRKEFLCWQQHAFNAGQLCSQVTRMILSKSHCKTMEMPMGCLTYHCSRDQVESSVSQPCLICSRLNLC